jgi:hypothetical protein
VENLQNHSMTLYMVGGGTSRLPLKNNLKPKNGAHKEFLLFLRFSLLVSTAVSTTSSDLIA